jgi:hypothetical protein
MLCEANGGMIMKITKRETKYLTYLYNNSGFGLFCVELKNTLKKLNFIRRACSGFLEIFENKEYFCVFNECVEQIFFAPKNEKKQEFRIFGDFLDTEDDIKIILKNVGE